MQEDSPHYLSHLGEIQKGSYSGQGTFNIVHEVEPTSLLVSFKPYRAFTNADVRHRIINLPYQYYIYKLSIGQNLNNGNVQITIPRFGLYFSPTSFESPDDHLYRPWLSNIVQSDNYDSNGFRFCFEFWSKYIPLEASPDDPQELIDALGFKPFVDIYDQFWGEVFNADAGGVKSRQASPYTTAIVTPFVKASKLSFETLADPESDWYTTQAMPAFHTKSRMKALLGYREEPVNACVQV